MNSFPAYATRFELFPQEGPAFEHLAKLIQGIERVDYSFTVSDPSVNQGQLASDFDDRLELELQKHGAAHCDLRLPPEVPQQFDFAFTFADKTTAVEVEKTNREKILRDVLKSHMYLHAGADFAVVGLPKNYPHTRGMWNLYDFGVQRFTECRQYGFGTADKLSRILLLGFEQFDADTNQPLTTAWRLEVRKVASQAKTGADA